MPSSSISPMRAGGGVYNQVQTSNDALARVVKRRSKPAHWGGVGEAVYTSESGGPRIMRSVIGMRSMHGRAIHPTEKPAALLEILIKTSCPPGGQVGDFFAGSGAAGDACAITGRRYIGCEADPGMAARANARLEHSLFGRRAEHEH
jgi:site-specific DNA-methyltransferase (adenine-specific)